MTNDERRTSSLGRWSMGVTKLFFEGKTEGFPFQNPFLQGTFDQKKH